MQVFASISKKKVEMEVEENSQAGRLIEIWKEIIAKQFEAIERAKIDGGKPSEERLTYSKYCEELGSLFVDVDNDLANAKEQYLEAFKYNPNKLTILLELAEINYLLRDIDGAESNCTKVLRSEPTNHWALRLLGECLMYKGEISKGIVGFTKVYNRDQTNFIALGQLFSFMRKAGQLSEVKEKLKQVEEKFGKNSKEPGLCYCRGLYFYYRKNPGAALVEFQKATRSPVYKNYALRMMVDIYLNPSQDLFYQCKGSVMREFVKDNIESMEILLDELDYKHFYAEKAIYNTYCHIILRNALDESEIFLKSFIEEKKNFAPAIICMCVLKMMKNKEADREAFKALSKIRNDPRWNDDCERGWLHVADYLISVGKYEYAERELQKILKTNKSSMAGLELLGTLYEKQNELQKAAKFYNFAWEISEKRDCQIGYRIASLHFKNCNWVRSIHIGKEVSF